MTEIICRPCDHDTYLAEKYGHAKYDENGYRIEPSAEDENYEQYVSDVLTFVVPSSVETVGQLCFNYANMKTVYLPEGVKTIEESAFSSSGCKSEKAYCPPAISIIFEM